MIIFNEHHLNEYFPSAPAHHNLTLDESRALYELQHNDQIVIKAADKGSAVVIMNRSDYITEGLRQISDPNFYIEVPHEHLLLSQAPWEPLFFGMMCLH